MNGERKKGKKEKKTSRLFPFAFQAHLHNLSINVKMTKVFITCRREDGENFMNEFRKILGLDMVEQGGKNLIFFCFRPLPLSMSKKVLTRWFLYHGEDNVMDFINEFRKIQENFVMNSVE